jgi:hypothetical protein
LSWGGSRTLVDRDFRPVAREELVARGGTLQMRPWNVGGAIGVAWAPASAELPGLAGVVGFRRALGRLQWGGDLELAWSPLSTGDFGGTELAVGVAPALGVRVLWRRVELSLDVALELRLAWEQLTRREAARFAMAGLPTSEPRTFLEGGPKPQLLVAIPVGRQLMFTATTALGLFVRSEGTASANHVALHPVLSLLFGVARPF